jgi:micrococcal nuclease
VYDGDTIRVDIDLGLGVWLRNQTLRLYGINAPEVAGKEKEQGIEARDWLRAWLWNDRQVLLRTHKDSKGKYGRWLAEVFIDNWNINEKMLQLGLAEEYKK